MKVQDEVKGPISLAHHMQNGEWLCSQRKQFG